MALKLPRHPDYREMVADSLEEYTKENIRPLHEVCLNARHFLKNAPEARSVNVIALDRTATVVLYEISMNETRPLVVLGEYDDLPD